MWEACYDGPERWNLLQLKHNGSWINQNGSVFGVTVTPWNSRRKTQGTVWFNHMIYINHRCLLLAIYCSWSFTLLSPKKHFSWGSLQRFSVFIFLKLHCLTSELPCETPKDKWLSFVSLSQLKLLSTMRLMSLTKIDRILLLIQSFLWNNFYQWL